MTSYERERRRVLRACLRLGLVKGGEIPRGFVPEDCRHGPAVAAALDLLHSATHSLTGKQWSFVAVLMEAAADHADNGVTLHDMVTTQ